MRVDLPPVRNGRWYFYTHFRSRLICLSSNKSQNEKTRALMVYKLEELTKRVEKHNSVVERTFLLEEKIKVANHRIEDLERKEE